VLGSVRCGVGRHAAVAWQGSRPVASLLRVSRRACQGVPGACPAAGVLARSAGACTCTVRCTADRPDAPGARAHALTAMSKRAARWPATRAMAHTYAAVCGCLAHYDTPIYIPLPVYGCINPNKVYNNVEGVGIMVGAKRSGSAGSGSGCHAVVVYLLPCGRGLAGETLKRREFFFIPTTAKSRQCCGVKVCTSVPAPS
jgi:hypothetical protein